MFYYGSFRSVLKAWTLLCGIMSVSERHNSKLASSLEYCVVYTPTHPHTHTPTLPHTHTGKIRVSGGVQLIR